MKNLEYHSQSPVEAKQRTLFTVEEFVQLPEFSLCR